MHNPKPNYRHFIQKRFMKSFISQKLSMVAKRLSNSFRASSRRVNVGMIDEPFAVKALPTIENKKNFENAANLIMGAAGLSITAYAYDSGAVNESKTKLDSSIFVYVEETLIPSDELSREERKIRQQEAIDCSTDTMKAQEKIIKKHGNSSKLIISRRVYLRELKLRRSHLYVKDFEDKRLGKRYIDEVDQHIEFVELSLSNIPQFTTDSIIEKMKKR
jgi:hypothetical protein